LQREYETWLGEKLTPLQGKPFVKVGKSLNGYAFIRPVFRRERAASF